MTIHRRKFLHKAFISFLSAGLIPPAVSFLKNHDISSFSIGELFAQLSFKKVTISQHQIAEKFSLEVKNSSGVINSGHILCAKETVCIPEISELLPGNKEGLVSVHQKNLNGFQRIISLNHWELVALNNMKVHLQDQHGIFDVDQLRELLIPVVKTRRHHTNRKIIEGDCSSAHGYFTGYGYCSIRILAKGNSMTFSTSLRNRRTIEMYKNSFEINSIV